MQKAWARQELSEESKAKHAATEKEEASTGEMELRVELAASLMKLHIAESELSMAGRGGVEVSV